jgi:hypothetical protein
MIFHRTQVVLIYGNSILMEGIADTLRTQGDVQVSTLPPQADASALTALHPDLIFLDALQFSPSQTEQIMNFFPAGEGPPILRLSADTQRLTVLSSQQFPAASFDGLARVIQVISKTVKQGEWI